MSSSNQPPRPAATPAAKAAFDHGVAPFQPGAVGVEIVFGEGAAPAQQWGGGASGGQPDHGQQGGAGAQDPGQDLPIAQLRLAGYAQGLFDAQLLGELIGGPDRAEALGGAQAQRAGGSVGQGGQRVGGASEGAADRLQDVGREAGKDGEGSGFDLGAAAVGLAQEDGSVGLALFAFGDNVCDERIKTFCCAPSTSPLGPALVAQQKVLIRFLSTPGWLPR